MRYKDYGFIKLENEKWIKIDFSKIVYIKSNSNYSHLFFENQERIAYKSPLIKLQSKLPLYFERVHNSYVININYINFVDLSSKTIQLNNKININIGSTYKDNLERYFMDAKKNKN